ncbi:hypothetical protein ACQKLX_27800 [Bosea sp. NPDC003192]|uniref:AbiU2 domain-containing protein n=1 Tax=Bosea sp. NPDC003192 TaxID=3390551 RepID=UPI003CFBE6A3
MSANRRVIGNFREGLSREAGVAKARKRKKRSTITRSEAVRRLGVMLKAINSDVEIVLGAEAALEEANSIVRATGGVKRPGVATYNVIAQSLTFNLAMSLARLFDPGSKRFKPNDRDLASIPLIVRLLRQKRCQDALARAARDWIPHMPSIADGQEAACRKAAKDAIAAFDAARRDPQGRRGIARLRGMRNKVLAHSFMDEVYIAMPTYNQLFRLVDCARDVLAGALFAIDGENAALVEIEALNRKYSKEFWQYALRLPSGQPRAGGK